MCGICGEYSFAKNASAGMDTIQRMADSLSHRGPDDEGFYDSAPLRFGFRRLSIIDLAGGHQPMSDREQKIWLVFNGEIYNFKELRAELESLGHVFQTRSDTEVIIHGYKQWGADVLARLNGMFGLAIWDQMRKRLIIARDPMGIKIVYFYVDAQKLVFGSEIRAVLAGLGAMPEVDPVSLNLFLRYRYTPSPRTLFKGIQKLAPGTLLVVENNTVRIQRWYQFEPTISDRVPSDNEAKEELLFLYKEAVKRHLLSDVPVGLLLSGGIDSGMLLGLMNLFGKNWKTYTIGYGKSYADDELEDAAATAKIYSSEHHSVVLQQDTFERTLPTIVKSLEEPVASSSVVPMYFVSERARQDVKVALIGQGPDELFGGYLRHLGAHYGYYWRGLPNGIQNLLARLIQSLPRNETLKRGIYSLNEPDRLRRYQQVFSILPGSLIDALFRDESLPPNAGDEILNGWEPFRPAIENLDELNGLQLLELRSSLPDELLMYGDKLSMAHSLEVRVPYLDREVVEYVQCLNASFKIRMGNRKWLHRQVCKNFLPPQIIKRRKKGFAVNVVDQWFKSTIKSKMGTLLLENESLMYRYLNPKTVQMLFKDHLSGKADNHKILFSLVVFEEWLRNLNSVQGQQS